MCQQDKDQDRGGSQDLKYANLLPSLFFSTFGCLPVGHLGIALCTLRACALLAAPAFVGKVAMLSERGQVGLLFVFEANLRATGYRTRSAWGGETGSWIGG